MVNPAKKKTITTGWANMILDKDIPRLTPWDFQLAHVVRQCLTLEYATKKKGEANPKDYYEMLQSLADAIALLRQQFMAEFPKASANDLLPLLDALTVHERMRQGCIGNIKFDMMWYLQHCPHLIAGSTFMNQHRTTVFKPFAIQEKIVEAICAPGPQLVFGIAPPGTGKTALVSHLLSLFPGHSLVFLCAALPVVLGVGRISNMLGIPYAFVKGRRLTPSYACGKALSTHVDKTLIVDGVPPMELTAVESLRYLCVKLNLERKKKRLATKKRQRGLFDLKRMARMFLMCDVGSCAWLLRQLDPNRTILVIDEPPMGSDVYPGAPRDNPLACAMVQTMLSSTYKTLWMSATLPRVNSLPTLVNSFLDRFQIPHEQKEAHVKECFSTELDRGALMCGPSGAIAFPHQMCTSAEELQKLCARLPADPLVLKAYTERALASLLSRWRVVAEAKGVEQEKLLPGLPKPEEKFSDLSELNNSSIRTYALEILKAIADTGIDELVAQFCGVSPEGEEGFFPEFNLVEILFSNAWAFPGLTLLANDNPKDQLMEMASRLLERMPTASDLEDDLKAQKIAQEKRERFRNDDEVDDSSVSGQARLKFSSELVIQSEQFLHKWCKDRPEKAVVINRQLPTLKEYETIKELPVEEHWQMLALSGAGAFDPKLNKDPGNPVYTQWVHDSMTRNRLACVTAGKEFTWGANVPAATVVVTKEFADTTSVAGMLQYVGRAARRGLTTHGQAVFERDEDLRRIFATPDGLSTEARTMERYGKWWITVGEDWSDL